MTTFAKTATFCAALVASAILGLGDLEFGASEAVAAENSAIYCQGYAQEAQRRYRDYRRKQCGNLVNIVWNPDYGAHYSYCMRNSQSTTAWVQDLRHKYLMNECNGYNSRRG
jgi:hypothetical protein